MAGGPVVFQTEADVSGGLGKIPQTVEAQGTIGPEHSRTNVMAALQHGLRLAQHLFVIGFFSVGILIGLSRKFHCGEVRVIFQIFTTRGVIAVVFE